MPRANRHYIPGYVWHITHRCHKKEFLLKFARDRRRWLQWLFETRKRHGLSVLNYTVTSNHIHLLVRDSSARDVIPASMQHVCPRFIIPRKPNYAGSRNLKTIASNRVEQDNS